MRLDSRPRKWYLIALSKLKCRNSSQTEHLRRPEGPARSAATTVGRGWGLAVKSNEVCCFNKRMLQNFFKLLILATSRSWSRTRTLAKRDLSFCNTAAGRIRSSRRHFSPSFSGIAASLTGTTCVITRIYCLTFCSSRTRGNIIASTMPSWVSFEVLGPSANLNIFVQQASPKIAKAFSIQSNATDWIIRSAPTSVSNALFSCSERALSLTACYRATTTSRVPGPELSSGCMTSSIVSVALLVNTTTAPGRRRLSRTKTQTASS